MENAFDEKYVFYRLISADLDEAHRSLQEIQRYKRGPVNMALIKNAIVSYARPFMQCKGKYRNDYRLRENDIVPAKYRKLHKKILDYRKQVVAHTDVIVKEPGLGKLNLGNCIIRPIRLKGKGFYFEDYIAIVDEMKDLCKAVSSSLKKTIKEYEKRLR